MPILELMGTMNASNLEPDGVLITKRGKPVARLVPADANCARPIGSLKGRIKIHGGILSTGLKWNAES